MNLIADTPEPPYYAVIFSSLTTAASEGYAETAARMVELAAQQPGFLGVESAREELGITVSYWTDLDSIKAWKAQCRTPRGTENGARKWYTSYKTRIARVERDYNK